MIDGDDWWELGNVLKYLAVVDGWRWRLVVGGWWLVVYAVDGAYWSAGGGNCKALEYPKPNGFGWLL